MNIAVVFPNEDSLYHKMGMEVYENFSEMRDVFTECCRHTGIDWEDALIYGDNGSIADVTFEKIAVLTTSIGFYKVFRKIYGIEPSLFIGKGIGYLSSLVCTEAIDYQTAISAISNERINNRRAESTVKSRCIDFEAYRTYSNEYTVDAFIEIGPGNMLVQQMQSDNPDAICGYLDSKNNNNIILDNFVERKYFNVNYLIKRILGMIASTQNLNKANENYDEILEAYSYAKTIVDGINTAKIENEDMIVAEEEFANCIRRLRTNFKCKDTPGHEIEKRIRSLECETLIPLKQDFADLFGKQKHEISEVGFIG